VRLRLAGEPDVSEFFDESAPERFFVKNLERVQGDERDAIILSVGYGKTADGRLLYRFGPLLTAGGERRLNVAITRARGRMTVVSSFSAADMDPARATGRGVALLREYLRYAASGGVVTAVAGDPVQLTPFDRDVLDRLTAAGVPVVPRYGLSGPRLKGHHGLQRDFLSPRHGFSRRGFGARHPFRGQHLRPEHRLHRSGIDSGDLRPWLRRPRGDRHGWSLGQGEVIHRAHSRRPPLTCRMKVSFSARCNSPIPPTFERPSPTC